MPRKPFALLRFEGPRFADHGLDVDVLPEIVAYKYLVQETAKEVWRRNNPQRERLPKGFDDELTLKFFNLEAGSTAVPLMREPRRFVDLFFRDDLVEAGELLEQTILAAGHGDGVPSSLPRSVIPLFSDLGKSLREDERLFISTGSRPRDAAVRYDRYVRQQILAWANEPYTDVVDLNGEARATDLDGLRFTLRMSDGRKIVGRFKPEHEPVVLDALAEHASRRMRVMGVGKYAPEDGALKQIVDVERIELIEPELAPEGGIPIWERLAAIGAAVPEDAWNNVPTDLSVNVDHYLYRNKDDPH